MAVYFAVHAGQHPLLRGICVGLITLLLILVSAGSQAAMVTAAVAANFTATMEKLVPLFEQRTGHTVRASYGSTGKLYAQIRHGAPFDVFLAADRARPERLEREGDGVAGTRFTYAGGRLVLWSREDNRLSDPESFLTSASGPRIAIGNPKTAPYGIAAMEVFDHLELLETVRPRLVSGDSIAQTFQFVATGNAGAGFVALAQVRAWNQTGGSAWLVPESLHSPITQQAQLLKRGKNNAAAAAFLAFLKSKEVRAIIEKDGYDTEPMPTD